MFDEVVNHYQHVQILPRLLQIVFEHSDTFDHYIHYFLEGLQIVGECC